MGGGSTASCTLEMEPRRSQRRKRQEAVSGDDQRFVSLLADGNNKVLVFTGSGISVPAGLSTFSDAGGLYERARKRHKLRDGMDLFKYSFYNKNPAACNSFMAQIAAEIRGAKPTDTHRALAKLEASGRLRRHVTMNIDGLAHDAGMSTWSPDCHQGTTLELHGTAREVVCTGCGHRATASKAVTKQLKDTMPVICESCGGGPVRWRVLLYGEPDDEQKHAHGYHQSSA